MKFKIYDRRKVLLSFSFLASFLCIFSKAGISDSAVARAKLEFIDHFTQEPLQIHSPNGMDLRITLQGLHAGVPVTLEAHGDPGPLFNFTTEVEPIDGKVVYVRRLKMGVAAIKYPRWKSAPWMITLSWSQKNRDGRLISEGTLSGLIPREPKVFFEVEPGSQPICTRLGPVSIRQFVRNTSSSPRKTSQTEKITETSMRDTGIAFGLTQPPRSGYLMFILYENRVEMNGLSTMTSPVLFHETHTIRGNNKSHTVTQSHTLKPGESGYWGSRTFFERWAVKRMKWVHSGDHFQLNPVEIGWVEIGLTNLDFFPDPIDALTLEGSSNCEETLMDGTQLSSIPNHTVTYYRSR